MALPGTVDLWNPKVIRSSMGAQFVHAAFHAGLDDVLGFIDRRKIDLWATAPSGDPLARADAPARLALAVGNEGAGVSSEIRAHAARTVSLPISGSGMKGANSWPALCGRFGAAS